MENKLRLLNKILINSKLILNEDPDPNATPDPNLETKRKAERTPVSTSNENTLDIKQVLDTMVKQQAQIDKLLKEKEEDEQKKQEAKEKEAKEKTEREGSEKSTEAIYDIVKQELEEIKKENKRVKEESEIKDYRNEIMETKPWLKDRFKDLLNKGGLSSRKEIDNAVTMLDELLKEKWDEVQNSKLAGASVEEISNMAKSSKPQETKKLTEEEEKEAQKEIYRKEFEKKMFVVYD